MTNKYVIDSSVWIEYVSGSEKAIKIIDIIEHEFIATSIIAIAEIADKFERDGKSFLPVLTFLQSRSTILPLGIQLCLEAARIKQKIRNHHSKFGLVDAIHLATALEEEAVLVTADKDFAGIENVIII